MKLDAGSLKVEFRYDEGDVNSCSGPSIVVVTGGVVIYIGCKYLHGDLLWTVYLSNGTQHQNVSARWTVCTEILVSTQHCEVVPVVNILLEGQICNIRVGRIVVEECKFMCRY